MVNNAFLPFGIEGSGCDGGSCQVVTGKYYSSSNCVAPFPVMATAVTTTRCQRRRVSVTVGSAGGGVTRKSLNFPYGVFSYG